MTDAQARPLAADSLFWQHLFWPQPFQEAAAFGLLRHFAAETHAKQLIFEARADDVHHHAARHLGDLMFFLADHRDG